MTRTAPRPLARSFFHATIAAAALVSLAGCGGPDDPYAAAVEASEAGDYKTAQMLLGEFLSDNPDNIEARRLAGDVAMRMGNTDRAITEYKAMQADPAHRQEGSDRLAQAYLVGGNPRMAGMVLEENGITTALGHSVAVGVAMAEGDGQQAVETLAQGLKAFPDSADLQVLDAYQALQSGDRAGAKRKLAAARKTDASLVDGMMLAGRIALLEDDTKMAGTLFEQVIAREPNNVTAIMALVALARDAGDDARAQTLLARVGESGLDNPVSVFFAAQMAFETGQTDRAFALTQGLQGGAGTAFPALTRLQGLIAAKRGQNNEAIVHLNRYLSDGGDDALARFVLAEVLRANGEPARAYAAIAPVVSGSRVDPRALQLAAALARQTNRPEAAALAARADKQGGAAPLTRGMQQASAAIRKGDWAAADKIYARLRASGNADHVPLLNNSALARLELGDAKGALALARKAHGLAKDDATVLDTLGWVIFKSGGSKAEARTLIARAARLKPSDTAIAANLRTVEAAAGA